MINLENLALYFVTHGDKTFIDGNNLKKNIINHMPRLNEFICNIHSPVISKDQMHLPSNENIHRTYTSFGKYKVIILVLITLQKKDMANVIFIHIHIHQHTLFDERPFEHEFFIKIFQAFPFLKKLTLTNSESQNSNDDNRKFPIIEYSHLTTLCLFHAHNVRSYYSANNQALRQNL